MILAILLACAGAGYVPPMPAMPSPFYVPSPQAYWIPPGHITPAPPLPTPAPLPAWPTLDDIGDDEGDGDE